MYSQIMDLLGITDFKIVNPYLESCNLDILIISKGYLDKVKKLNPDSKIIEIKSATFLDLVETLEYFKNERIGNLVKIDESIEMLKKMDLNLKNEHHDFIQNFEYNLSSDSKFITKIIEDLCFKNNPNKKTIKIIPDYSLSSVDNFDSKNTIILKTHNYDLTLLERIKDRYVSILDSLNNIIPEKT